MDEAVRAAVHAIDSRMIVTANVMASPARSPMEKTPGVAVVAEDPRLLDERVRRDRRRNRRAVRGRRRRADRREKA